MAFRRSSTTRDLKTYPHAPMSKPAVTNSTSSWIERKMIFARLRRSLKRLATSKPLRSPKLISNRRISGLADRFDSKLKRRSQAMPPPYIPNPAFQRPLPAEPGYRLPIKALDVPRYLCSFEVFCPKRRTCRGLSYSQPDTLSTSKTSRPLFLGAWLDESSRLNIASIEQACQ